MNNVAFIDGQNLHVGLKKDGWSLNHRKFYTYLEDKYNITKAFYFMGIKIDRLASLYNNLNDSGFIVIFKDHNENFKSNKKGNVDTDIVFEVMKYTTEHRSSGDIILVSDDGDYYKMIKYLINKRRFIKILFPTKNASGLYKDIGSEYYDYLYKFKHKIIKGP